LKSVLDVAGKESAELDNILRAADMAD